MPTQTTISVGDEVYAVLVSNKTIKEGTEWFGNQFESLQASRMNYEKGKIFKIHTHILNPRTIKRTQEAFIVVMGTILVDIYKPDGKRWIGALIARSGEAVLVYRGGHGVRFLEDSIAYEIKAGCYSVVSEDKLFIDEKDAR